MKLLQRLHKRRSAVSPLGHGVSGKVELHDDGSTCFVVKTYYGREAYENRKEYRDRVLAEFHVLDKLSHPNIVEALKYDVSLNGDNIKLYLEAGTEDLCRIMKSWGSRMALGEKLCLWRQVCSGVRYLHEKGYCHRDLKLENLVLGRDTAWPRVMIIDFATAALTSADAVGIVGSPKYMAPEMESSIAYDGASADVWSLGIILVYMATATFPWKQASRSDSDFMGFVSNFADVPSKCSSEPSASRSPFDSLPGSLNKLAAGLLQVDAKQRDTTEQLFLREEFQQIACCGYEKRCGNKHTLPSIKS